MKFFKASLSGCWFIILLSISSHSYSQNPIAYEQRRTDYINNSLSNFSSDAITIQAYRGLPLDTATLNYLVNGIPTKGTVDFDIVKLIRILFFTNGVYDAQIVPALNQIPYWINKGDTLHGYWSENHMIMWMSSDWLLHEKYGRAIDNNLENRLRHYLKLKVKYGFYEFFSSVYAPYCLSGLLNLADFAQDIEIKTLAIQAAQILLKDFLMLTNDKGVFYPAAGRNYYGKYDNPYGQNHSNLIYLMTGFGPSQTSASHSGGFLASSTIPMTDVINSWTPILDTLYHIGHTLDSGFAINNSMSIVDKVIFQWSSGAYFHPEVSLQTAYLLRDSNLWNHVDFAALRMLSSFSPQAIQSLTSQFISISASSVICGQDVAIFKHNSITLSSIQDFWKGKLGYQQIPCVANVGTTAVMTASGIAVSDWNDRNESANNQHLPYVKQIKNVALLMYRPEPKPDFLNYNNPEVALRWIDADFDEIRNDSMWLLGRQAESFVGVRRSCVGEINGARACDIPNGQAWVIIVGDTGIYGSFDNFQSIIDNSQFEQKWYYDSLVSKWVFFAKIVIDSTTIEYAWAGDSMSTVGINKEKIDNKVINVFPNPSTDFVDIDFSSLINQSFTIDVTNLLGQKIYTENINTLSSGIKTLNTTNWNNGVYILSINTYKKHIAVKFVKKE